MTPATASKLIHLGEIAPRERHAAVFAAFKALDVGDALEIISDLDPDALYFEFQRRTPGDFSWRYVHREPVWRVSVQKLGRSHGTGDCCGACGSA